MRFSIGSEYGYCGAMSRARGLSVFERITLSLLANKSLIDPPIPLMMELRPLDAIYFYPPPVHSSQSPLSARSTLSTRPTPSTPFTDGVFATASSPPPRLEPETVADHPASPASR